MKLDIKDTSELKADMEFLLSFVPATQVSQVVSGLVSVCYITGNYEDELKLVEKIENIMGKYNLAIAASESEYG